MSGARAALFAAISTALVLVLIEGVFSWAYALTKAWERSAPIPPEVGHARHDPDLGWSHVPNLHVRDLYGPGRHFTSNGQGHRAPNEFAKEVPAGRRRVLFFGDSFTMGVGVGDEHTYPAQVEARDPRIQSVNMGMGAYGVDQAYLWYERDGDAIAADAVVLAFIEHDFIRMATDFYMAPKPQLRLDGDAFTVTNRPVPERDLGRRFSKAASQFTHTLDTSKVLRRVLAVFPQRERRPAAFAGSVLAERMFEAFAALAAERGHVPVLVYLPSLGDLEEDRPVREWLRKWTDGADVRFADLTDRFRAAPPHAELFLPDRHYSEAGNGRAAEAIHDVLLAALGMSVEDPRDAR